MPETKVSFEDACRRIKVTPDLLRRLVSEGELRAIRTEDGKSICFLEEQVALLEYRDAPDDQYFDFAVGLRELRISPDQLKRLVSEGEIRAIRGPNNVLRFRKDEIDRLKQSEPEYVGFETAMRDLKVSADQLKRLVSEGELRAVRGEHYVMKFVKDEIDRLAEMPREKLEEILNPPSELSDELTAFGDDDVETEKDPCSGELESDEEPTTDGGRRTYGIETSRRGMRSITLLTLLGVAITVIAILAIFFGKS